MSGWTREDMVAKLTEDAYFNVYIFLRREPVWFMCTRAWLSDASRGPPGYIVEKSIRKRWPLSCFQKTRRAERSTILATSHQVHYIWVCENWLVALIGWQVLPFVSRRHERSLWQSFWLVKFVKEIYQYWQPHMCTKSDLLGLCQSDNWFVEK